MNTHSYSVMYTWAKPDGLGQFYRYCTVEAADALHANSIASDMILEQDPDRQHTGCELVISERPIVPAMGILSDDITKGS